MVISEESRDKLIKEMYPLMLQCIYNCKTIMACHVRGEDYTLRDNAYKLSLYDCIAILDIFKKVGIVAPQRKKTELHDPEKPNGIKDVVIKHIFENRVDKIIEMFSPEIAETNDYINRAIDARAAEEIQTVIRARLDKFDHDMTKRREIISDTKHAVIAVKQKFIELDAKLGGIIKDIDDCYSALQNVKDDSSEKATYGNRLANCKYELIKFSDRIQNVLNNKNVNDVCDGTLDCNV